MLNRLPIRNKNLPRTYLDMSLPITSASTGSGAPLILNAHHAVPPNKNLIVAIDLGVTNLAICAGDPSDPTKIPYIEKCSFLTSIRTGDVFSYSEPHADAFAKMFVEDRWEYLFSKAKVVVLEKQMDGRNTFRNLKKKVQVLPNGFDPKTGLFMEEEDLMTPEKKNRSCVVLETALRCTLRNKMDFFNGPMFCSFHPSWWKRRAGVEVGNNPVRVDGYPSKNFYAENNSRKRNPNYHEHKDRAVTQFNALKVGGDREAQQVAVYYQGLTVDMIEAYLIYRAARDNLGEVMKKAFDSVHKIIKPQITKPIHDYFKAVNATREGTDNRANLMTSWSNMRAPSSESNVIDVEALSTQDESEEEQDEGEIMDTEEDGKPVVPFTGGKAKPKRQYTKGKSMASSLINKEPRKKI